MFPERIRRAALTTAAVASLAIAAGGGTASAAITHPATSVTWTDLTLINGWASSESQWGSGDPAWTVRDGIVYLSGSAQLTTGTSTEVAVLPPAARPAKTQYLTVYTYANTSGIVDVFPDGRVYVNASSIHNPESFTSFAGLSFPAAATARHQLALENGWKTGLAAWKTGAPAYSVSDGIVHLSGSLRLPGKGGGVFAVLPKSARPARTVYIPVLTYDFSVGNVLISPDGDMEINGSGGANFTSLAGVAFTPASAGRTTVPLINGWKSGQGQYHTGAPAFSITNGIVHLSGSVLRPAGTVAEFGVLPASARPAHNLYIQVTTLSGTVGTVEIESDGALWAFNGTGSAAAGFTSLAGLSYPLKS